MGNSKKHDAAVVDIQDRDLALLRGLFESRVMTVTHIAALYFDRKKEYAKKRLQKLKAAGLITGRRRRVVEPVMLSLTQNGLSLLRERGALAEYPALDPQQLQKRTRVSDFTLEHELEVMDIKASFHTAIRNAAQFSIVEFNTWPLLNQFESVRGGLIEKEVIVKPDGFIRIHEREADGGLFEHTFYLEVDRSTEAQDVLVSRAGCYVNYFKSGGFAVKNGALRSAYKDYPFRVLIVFKNAERRNITTERLLKLTPPIFTQVYLATSDEARNDPLGAIWIRPLDYRAATKGTPFDPDQRCEQYGYQRQTARELFVEQNVKKQKLLSD